MSDDAPPTTKPQQYLDPNVIPEDSPSLRYYASPRPSVASSSLHAHSESEKSSGPCSTLEDGAPPSTTQSHSDRSRTLEVATSTAAPSTDPLPHLPPDVCKPRRPGGLPMKCGNLTAPDWHGDLGAPFEDDRTRRRDVVLRRLGPAFPTELQRYDRSTRAKTAQPVARYIQPNERTFDDDEDPNYRACCAAGWVPRVHPEGARYFFHRQLRAWADGLEQHPAFLRAADLAISQLKQKIDEQHIELPADVELVLELDKEQHDHDHHHHHHHHQPTPTDPNSVKRSEFKCGYYFVDHTARCLFWLDPVDISPLCENVTDITRKSHIALALESQYWQHCEYFPAHRPIVPSVTYELKGMINHAISEMVTSETSLSPFSNEELIQTRDIVIASEEVPPEGLDCSASICIIARFMRLFTRNRFFNFYGQPGARLDSDQAVYRDKKTIRNKSMLIRVFTPLLFNAPSMHWEQLRKIWVDSVVSYVPWMKFINDLNQEWKSYTLYSTVLLTANISFLALFNVMPQTELQLNITSGAYANDQLQTPPPTHPQTVSEILSYASTIASTGSIVLGLVLVRQNRTKSRQSVDNVIAYLGKISENPLGIEMLAIVYSLPYSLLMWGLIIFAAAFGALAYQETGPATRWTVGVCGTITLTLVLWPVFLGRDLSLPFPRRHRKAPRTEPGSEAPQRSPLVSSPGCAKAEVGLGQPVVAPAETFSSGKALFSKRPYRRSSTQRTLA
ncbi:hypothetical protein CONPUDRAFT_152845 [Coniophora puteana RWD-64-598 SS2]|uniref:WW domain-containing protein n=1 Tax=Coniophora puteana (strain RWD-64-598) TaxID=741705 RepID=A0A5M3MS25_CONPW|nr:uncharacterized protein CONPUDRAFT_152845 [Coniophora puteana RWD-64-598 SS2]EIW81953.1 hypothetical protein CONPUDRAFT_152845 [Coniophora puteana RWD-64-598 SS2]